MQDQDRQAKRSEILAELRAHFGDDRTGELGDMDGVGLLATFLRRISDEDDDAPDGELAQDERFREDMRLMRHRRHDRVVRESDGEQEEQALAAASGQAGQHGDEAAMTFGALIEEIPRMRENLGEWIGGVDADYLPSSSTREELDALLTKAEYRLKVLKVMVNETQREIEALTLAIRADAAAGKAAE